MKIFKKEKIGKRRIFYLFNKKILSYHKRISATGGGGTMSMSLKLNIFAYVGFAR